MTSSAAACSDAEKANLVLNAPRLPGPWRESVEFSGEESQKDTVILHGSPKHFKQSTTTDASSEEKILDLEKNSSSVDRSQWVLNGPEPPGLWHELMDTVRETTSYFGNKYSSLKSQPMLKSVVSIQQEIFPILVWGRSYSISKFKHDLMAGLTIASLCIPQSIGYATLAKLDPQYGLYTSVVPPLIYAIMGTSREIAIGPVAVVSLLLPSMLLKLQDPGADPIAYTKLVLTATFFTGIFQAAFGIFRLGFLVDFLSHAAIVGFVAGAAIIIGLQQLKGLLGIAHFPTSTDVISVMEAVWSSFHHPWNPHNFMLGCSFLCFILISRFVGRKNKKLFWLPAIAPLLSVILSTLIVYLTRADKHGIKIVKHIKEGLNPSSVHLLQLNSPYVGDVAKVGLIIAIVALTEAIAVGKSFSSIKGYRINGNKEMMSMGFMNIVGSLTSCYVATGSFSRTAVNFSAGCETPVSNIVMAITVTISLEFFTRLLYFTPTAILASIILSALPGLININEIYNIWKVDKLDFLACIGAFFGVLFASVEIGLLLAVAISFTKIILISIRPGTETLGQLPGTDMFCDTEQYPMAITVSGIMIVRVKSALLCFANSNFVRERIVRWIAAKKAEGLKGNNTKDTIQVVILDMSNLINIDTSGIATLEDLQRNLLSEGIELAVANPRWQVIHKLKISNFIGKIGGRVFVTVAEAVAATFTGKIATTY
ncbi:PREDICTED: low affinity sulfate transporter 3-like [Fragaria vesca subsp. vesca]|uniref:low affinity sulfate transporter 3-like n=1 Tax=Fragaria vesca subsp. vesca TaxID=101020 RepID=UPI0002C2F5A2|nr:PREDICTED: low affinity sulfate transporter 3-like [Fragaria vesca subsp. vesca]